jgi:hypothetical protein
LEESQAALHELGRENQTLQVIVSRYSFQVTLKAHLVVILSAEVHVFYSFEVKYFSHVTCSTDTNAAA